MGGVIAKVEASSMARFWHAAQPQRCGPQAWRVWLALCLRVPGLKAACLVARALTRMRHMRNELRFNWRRIRAITADSFNPNCFSMASKGVRSSHAISMTRDTSAAFKASSGLSPTAVKRPSSPRRCTRLWAPPACLQTMGRRPLRRRLWPGTARSWRSSGWRRNWGIF